ncbi:hypothetical protein BKA70DRAFT_1268850 [Coprinopsis sp. MPI-PUGE-AT-0042]|nr:hypothetical protein BKA70DRAFT_1268850 [Coprinopsis sp. MPI-PUGE-AT-0042]
MPNWIPIDDTSSQIGYSGSWSTLKGSSRQWEGGVHSTTQNGASAVLRFKGVAVLFRGTVPSGSGNQVFRYQIDDGASREVSTPSALMRGSTTITLTNAGGAPFQVDMLEYQPGEGDPNPAALLCVALTESSVSQPTTPPPPPPPPPTTTRAQPPAQTTSRPPSTQRKQDPQPQPDPDLPTAERTRTVASSNTQVITSPTIASAENSEATNGGHVINKIIPTATERVVSTVTVVEAFSSGGPLPLGAIIGIAVGAVIAVLAVLIFLLLCRRRRKARNARYAADTQHQAGGFSDNRDGYAAAHSSAELISPFRGDSPAHTPVSSTPFWRKSHHLVSPSLFSGVGFSTVTSGISYTGENAAVAS